MLCVNLVCRKKRPAVYIGLLVDPRRSCPCAGALAHDVGGRVLPVLDLLQRQQQQAQAHLRERPLPVRFKNTEMGAQEAEGGDPYLGQTPSTVPSLRVFYY